TRRGGGALDRRWPLVRRAGAGRRRRVGVPRLPARRPGADGGAGRNPPRRLVHGEGGWRGALPGDLGGRRPHVRRAGSAAGGRLGAAFPALTRGRRARRGMGGVGGPPARGPGLPSRAVVTLDREGDPDGRCLPVRGDRGRPGGRGLARGRGGPAPHARVGAVTSPTTDAE